MDEWNWKTMRNGLDGSGIGKENQRVGSEVVVLLQSTPR